MGKAWKVERWSHRRRHGKVFLDIYHYDNGSRLFLLRREVEFDAPAKASPRTLVNYGDYVVSWAVNTPGGKARRPRKNLRNRQDRAMGEGWTKEEKLLNCWITRWEDCNDWWTLEGEIVYRAPKGAKA